MTMSSFRSAPRVGCLEQVKRICGYVSKMRHPVIYICTDEPDYSDIPGQSTTGNSLYTVVQRKRFRRMRPCHWVSLLSPQLTSTLTYTIACSQANRFPGFCICSTTPQLAGMLVRSNDQQRRLLMVPSLLLQEQQLSKLLTTACH